MTPAGGRKTRYAGGRYGEKSCAGCDDNTEKRGRAGAPPPPRLDAQRLKRAEREQEILSLLLNRLAKRETETRYGKSGDGGPRLPGKRDRETVAAWRVPGKRFCGPGVD